MRYLNRNENIYKSSIFTIGQELINVIKLSLNKNGDFDTSELEFKKEIAKKITTYSRLYEQDWSNVILEYSKDENGEIDLEFCNCLATILISCIDDEDVATRISQASLVVEKIIEQYPKNYKEVINNMIASFIKGEDNIFS